MTEKQFLSTLNRKLWWDVPKTERKAAILSYQKFFAENRDSDEAELVAECGDIGLIADEILVEYGQTNHPVRRFLAVMVLWLVAGWLPCSSFLLFSNITNDYLLQSFGCIILPLVTVWIIGGKKLTFKHLPSKKVFLLFFLGGAVGMGVLFLAIEFLVNIPLLVSISSNVDPSLVSIWERFGISQIGAISTTTFEISSLFVGLFACFTCLMAIRRNIYFLAALPICSGVLLFIFEHHTFLCGLDTSSDDPGEIYRLVTFLAYRHIAAGFLCALLLTLAIFLWRKVRKW